MFHCTQYSGGAVPEGCDDQKMEEEHGSVWEDPAYYQEDPNVQLVSLLLREIVHSTGVYVPLHTFIF